MGLFSVRNFAAPFTNTVNLIAIVFLVLLFAVFRFSSGRYQVAGDADGSGKAPAASMRQMPSIDAFLATQTEKSPRQVEEAVAAPSPVEAAPQKKVLDNNNHSADLTGEIEALSAKAKQTTSSKKSPPKNEDAGLNDIEKALGIK